MYFPTHHTIKHSKNGNLLLYSYISFVRNWLFTNAEQFTMGKISVFLCLVKRGCALQTDTGVSRRVKFWGRKMDKYSIIFLWKVDRKIFKFFSDIKFLLLSKKSKKLNHKSHPASSTNCNLTTSIIANFL